MISIYLHKNNIIAVPPVISKTFSFSTRYYGIKTAKLSLSSKGVYKLTIDGYDFSALEQSAKRSSSYKTTLLDLSNVMTKEIEKYNFAFVYFYKWTNTPKNRKFVEENLSKVKLKKYDRIPFNLPQPRKTDVYDDLCNEANASYYSIWFSNNSKKEQYAKYHLEEENQKRIDLWNDLKGYHESIQDALEHNANSLFQKEYEAKCKVLNDELTGPIELVDKRLNDISNLWKLPFDVALNIDYHKEEGIVDCNVIITETINIPTTTVQLFSTGKIGILEKTKKEIERDYSTCLLGLSFYLAGFLFNASLNINKVRLSVEKKLMSYYWVEFDREDFSKINFESSLEPLNDIYKFPLVINLKSTSIIPIDKNDFTKQIEAAIQVSKLLKANPNLTTMLLRDADYVSKHIDDLDLEETITKAKNINSQVVIVDKKYVSILHELKSISTKKDDEDINIFNNDNLSNAANTKQFKYVAYYKPLVKDAAYYAIKHYKYSTEMLMNDLSVDEITAKKIIVELQKKGIVGGTDKDGYCKVLVNDENRLDFIFSWTN